MRDDRQSLTLARLGVAQKSCHTARCSFKRDVGIRHLRRPFESAALTCQPQICLLGASDVSAVAFVADVPPSRGTLASGRNLGGRGATSSEC